MSTMNNPTAPTAARHEDFSAAPRGNNDLHRVNRPARGEETKAFYKTSEFIVFIVATVAVLLASFFVKAADGHDDYFAADKAWLYVAILSVGYMVSRGLAKSGSRHHDDA
jgi:hypothetical protein